MTDIVERLRRMADMTTIGNDLADIGKAADEIERLRAAIAWALGEQPDAEGKWFGETYDEQRKRYGWRSHLRKIAGLPTLAYDKASRSIVRTDEQLQTKD